MRTYKETIEIDAAPELVWMVLSEVIEWPLWLPTVSAVAAHSDRDLRVGASFTVTQPKLRPTVWVVTALEAPERFVWEARSTGLHLTASHMVKAAAAAKSVVSLSMSFDGFMSGVITTLFGRLTHRYLAQELASLKSVVSSGSPASAGSPALRATLPKPTGPAPNTLGRPCRSRPF